MDELLRCSRFLNRDDVDFSVAADLTPVQEWALSSDLSSSLEYPTKYVHVVVVCLLYFYPSVHLKM